MISVLRVDLRMGGMLRKGRLTALFVELLEDGPARELLLASALVSE